MRRIFQSKGAEGGITQRGIVKALALSRAMKWSIQVSWRLSGTGSFQSSEFSSWNESFIWSRSGSHHPTGSKNSAVRDSTPALVIRSSLKAERRPSAVVTSRSGAAFCPLIFFCKFMLEMLGLMKSCWVFQVSPRHPTVWPSLEEPSGGGWPERERGTMKPLATSSCWAALIWTFTSSGFLHWDL